MKNIHCDFGAPRNPGLVRTAPPSYATVYHTVWRRTVRTFFWNMNKSYCSYAVMIPYERYQLNCALQVLNAPHLFVSSTYSSRITEWLLPASRMTLFHDPSKKAIKIRSLFSSNRHSRVHAQYFYRRVINSFSEEIICRIRADSSL